VNALEAHLVGAKIHVSFTASDAISPVTHAQYSIDAGRWQFVGPEGGIGDSLAEPFAFDVPLPQRRADDAVPADPAEHVVSIRVFDRFENVVTVKAVVR
jgi:hypothetical protein